jgi:hypothetical protein
VLELRQRHAPDVHGFEQVRGLRPAQVCLEVDDGAVDEPYRGDPVGVPNRQFERDVTSPRVAHDMDARDAEVIEQSHGVGAYVLPAVTRSRLVGFAVAALVGGN